MRIRASFKDRQAEVRTKIADQDADRLEALAKRWGVSEYEAARRLILAGLDRHKIPRKTAQEIADRHAADAARV